MNKAELLALVAGMIFSFGDEGDQNLWENPRERMNKALTQADYLIEEAEEMTQENKERTRRPATSQEQ